MKNIFELPKNVKEKFEPGLAPMSEKIKSALTEQGVQIDLEGKEIIFTNEPPGSAHDMGLRIFYFKESRAEFREDPEGGELELIITSRDGSTKNYDITNGGLVLEKRMKQAA